jgi:catechol 2,3-dioxygenase-like lactoylglutathione lyase family enzyme
MENQGQDAPASPFAGLPVAQVAIVVKDIDQARRQWAELLGQKVPDIITTAPGAEVHQTHRGAPSGARTKLAFLNLGPVQLELIEPIPGDDGSSTWHEGLESGEGLHHIAFWVEGMQKHADFLKERGATLAQRGDMGDGQYAYFDGGTLNGVTVELLERKRESRVE